MPESQAQLRLAHAVAEGNSKAMPKKTAEEMINAFHGRKMSELPEHTSDSKERTRRSLFGK